MKIYVTFGQKHRHIINGKVFDKDCVAEIDCIDFEHGRKTAFKLFGRQFCFTYFEPPNMHHFPRGIVSHE